MTNQYELRDRTLLQMGFASYQLYLSSKAWANIRKKVFITKGKKCWLCRRPGKQVHHISYDEKTLRGLTLEFLIPICRRCHEHVECDKEGNKRPFKEVAKMVTDLRKVEKARLKIKEEERKPHHKKKKARPRMAKRRQWQWHPVLKQKMRTHKPKPATPPVIMSMLIDSGDVTLHEPTP